MKCANDGFPFMDGCEIFDCGIGFYRDSRGYRYSIDDARIFGNYIHENDIGIILEDDRFDIINNTISRNRIGVDISESGYGISYYVDNFHRISGNTFRENNVAVDWCEVALIYDCNFVDNTQDIISGMDNRFFNNSFAGSKTSIYCTESSPLIENCTFNEIKRHVFIESDGHPKVNSSDLNISKVYWGYYNEWSTLNSTVTIDGIVHEPEFSRSEYLGERYDPEPWWDEEW
jgi:parallel beta-helix repeat protein